MSALQAGTATIADTQHVSYAERLRRKETATWKRVLDVQRPYRWNLRRQELGRTLDVGCGLGRNLQSLRADSVGVDHNEASVRIAVQRGLHALTVEQWRNSPLRVEATFDSLLLAHVVEHMTREEAHDLLVDYLGFVRPGGKVMLICPQERGYASDATHVSFVDPEALCELARGAGLKPGLPFSFPLPRQAGRYFTYNEFCLVATKDC